MPRFKGLRADKPPAECTMDQLDGVKENESSSKDKLTEYASKRNFQQTPEPAGGEKKGEKQIFVVQEHHARALHFDLRLEKDGVLKSWAVPKGIPETSTQRHLAVETEDHPFEYAKFEGSIPKGQYGAGTVKIWDKGTYETKFWDENKIEFTLNGQRLNGRYVLVWLKKARSNQKSWLLLKSKD
jgi:bifunctional non-homologous end joining protein LigD